MLIGLRFRRMIMTSELILFSENLRREIALYSSRRFIQNVVLFRDLPRNALESIVVNLKMELYLPNDMIIKAGTQGDCMFFLASGTVAVLTPTGKEVSFNYSKKI